MTGNDALDALRRAVAWCPRCAGSRRYTKDGGTRKCRACAAAWAALAALKWQLRERDKLLAMTEQLREHPEGYDGPCNCRMCHSYG